MGIKNKTKERHTRQEAEIPENIQYLSGSSNRVIVLDYLAENSEKPAEIREHLEIPRSTFRRILSEMEDRNWVEKRKNEYTATELGEYVEKSFTEFVDTMDVLEALSEFREHVPSSEVDVDFETLAESEVVVSAEHRPHAPLETYLDAVEDADEIQAVSPVISDLSSEKFYDNINNGTEVHNVVRKEVIETIFRRWEDRMESVVDTGRTQTWVYEGELPFGLMIADDTVHITAHDDSGVMRAVVVTDSKEALEWASEYHQQLTQKAVTLEKYF
jgi:predicted transcriptional regulator